MPDCDETKISAPPVDGHPGPDRLRKLERGLNPDVQRGGKGVEADGIDRFRPQDRGVVDEGVDRAGEGGDGRCRGPGIRQIDGQAQGRAAETRVHRRKARTVHVHQHEVGAVPGEHPRDGGAEALRGAGNHDFLGRQRDHTCTQRRSDPDRRTASSTLWLARPS